jgi:hypothetical protein
MKLELLNPDQIDEVWHFAVESPDWDAGELWKLAERRRHLMKAQARLTLQQVFPLFDKLFELIEHGDYSNGVTANEGTVDEGRVYAAELLHEYRQEVEQLRAAAEGG